ncbi:MAG: TonB-dependent receptor [Bacteroidales bacterium]|nr:TonB-dependent receptor [Bacteroidales bacterium]MBQ7489809.1 TonB-dependent receptor [Bacteroidales bacterium]
MMKRVFESGLLLVLLVVFPQLLDAQNKIRGTVKDSGEGFPLAYAMVRTNCSSEVVMTDNVGQFVITVLKDTCDLEISYSLYETFKRKVVFTGKKHEVRLDVRLNPQAVTLDQTSVTASKYETNVEKSTNSILVLNTKTVENQNITTVDGLLNKAGGVAVVDNEPQIRGGSGFSSGMGSRVMIMLDYMPLLRPDAGRPMWTFIPMEDVEQVEILKGAASVVFGSSALTGAINVLTAYPRSEPRTKVTMFAGIYDDPNPEYRTSWIHQNPIKCGVSFLHSRIIKNNFDLVVGGEYFYDKGYIGPEERVSETINKNGDDVGKFERRARFNFATRYRPNKVKGLSVSLNGNFMYSQNNQTFMWFDADTNRYRSYKGSMSKFRDCTFYVDPVVQYVARNGWVHTFRNRLTFSNNMESTGNQNSQSFVVYDEYQFNKQFRFAMNFVGGIMNMYAESVGPLFNGDNYSLEPAKMYSDNLAVYAQIEQKLLKHKNLNLSFGARWEMYKLKDVFENKPIFRAGISYQLDTAVTEARTSFRASFGQGYRYPSIGERFIAIHVGRYGFYPNPELVSETSWNVEVGIMQPFGTKDKRFWGMFDVAAFYQSYKNYIEFCMGPWGDRGSFMDRFGFRFLNTGPATITGVDANFMTGGTISDNVSYSISLSYNYNLPIAKNPDKAYYSNDGKEYTFNNTSSDTTRKVLKYRIEHMAKFDVEFTFWKQLSIGFTGSYYSAMKNVDKFFFSYDVENPNLSAVRIKQLRAMGDLPFCGYYNYFNSKDYQRGSWVFDARLSYTIKDVTLSFIVKNLFNKSYALRPLYVEPTRTFTLQLVYNFDKNKNNQ